MKKMTCKDLGGACDMAFVAANFESMAKQSQAHGKEMLEKADPDHLKAMQKMKEVMRSPETMESWMQEKRRLFDSLPNLED